MGDTPAFGVRFHPYRALVVVRDPEPGGDPPERVRVYSLALELAARIYAVIEHADTERYFLRDQLDRKSASVPQLIAQGLATADMVTRRALYVRARQAVTDCAAILDIRIPRATVARGLLDPARAISNTLVDELLPLTVPPPRVR